MHREVLRRAATAGVAVALTAGMAACGSSSSSSGSSSSGARPATLAITISQHGGKPALTVPSHGAAGLVRVVLTNKTPMPRILQLVQVRGSHSIAQALKVVGGNSNTTPGWLRATGGVSAVGPSQTGDAVVDLAPGRYAVAVLPAGPGGSSGPPASGSLMLSGGSSGALPTTQAKVVGEHTGMDHYAWKVSGLKAGVNRITFESQGMNAIHFVGAVKIKGNPSLAAIKKALSSNKPPAFADLSTYTQSAILDGGRSEVTTMTFTPGTYVLFCPLSDRDGGKPHFMEGMLAKVTVH